MTNQLADQATERRTKTVLPDTALHADTLRQRDRAADRNIALLTPYTGHNLGDAAIQDAVIANLRLRLADPQFSGVTLNCCNFIERHGDASFPLCGPRRPFYGMYEGRVALGDSGSDGPSTGDEQEASSNTLRRILKRIRPLWWCLKTIRSSARRVWGELNHWVRGYRFLRTQDLLIVSGGGQLDEEWGGAWGHPFALFKWAILARIAGVRYVIASVGACKIDTRACRFFLSQALRRAQYRSYRDEHSRAVAAGLLRQAANDPVIPDLAFSLPASELPRPTPRPSTARGRVVVGISPIAYAKPGTWAYENSALYDRYLQQMAIITSQLLDRNYSLVFVWSGLGDDDRVAREILDRLDEESKDRADRQIHMPSIITWRDLVSSLQDVDFLIASRLHSAILGFVAQKPTISISFDPKVDWLMEDLGQTDYLLQIRDFTARDVLKALDKIELHSGSVKAQIRSYQLRIEKTLAAQYDKLAEFAAASDRIRS
jgi:polysaccharide pyruvyl transferase WcaK-like protein